MTLWFWKQKLCLYLSEIYIWNGVNKKWIKIYKYNVFLLCTKILFLLNESPFDTNKVQKNRLLKTKSLYLKKTATYLYVHLKKKSCGRALHLQHKGSGFFLKHAYRQNAWHKYTLSLSRTANCINVNSYQKIITNAFFNWNWKWRVIVGMRCGKGLYKRSWWSLFHLAIIMRATYILILTVALTCLTLSGWYNHY